MFPLQFALIPNPIEFCFLCPEMILYILGLFFSNLDDDFFLRSEIYPNIQQPREKEVLEDNPAFPKDTVRESVFGLVKGCWTKICC